MIGTGVQGSVLTSSDSNWNSGQQYLPLVTGIFCTLKVLPLTRGYDKQIKGKF